MTWSQSYAEDPPATHRHQQGVKTTTTGHPRAMHSFAMNAWDPIGGELVVGVRQMDYGLERLPQVKWRGTPRRVGGTTLHRPVDGHQLPQVQISARGHVCYVPPLR